MRGELGSTGLGRAGQGSVGLNKVINTKGKGNEFIPV